MRAKSLPLSVPFVAAVAEASPLARDFTEDFSAPAFNAEMRKGVRARLLPLSVLLKMAVAMASPLAKA